MIQVNDLVSYNQHTYTCWFIEETNGERHCHILSEDGSVGFCVIDTELVKIN